MREKHCIQQFALYQRVYFALHQKCPFTRDQLFEYFIDKIFLDANTITIATYYYDTEKPIEIQDLENAHEMREVRTFPKEFEASPRSGANGIRTRDLFHAMEARYQLRHSPKYLIHTTENHTRPQREYSILPVKNLT